MADHEHFTPKQMIEAIKKSKGFITVAARHLGCAPSTVGVYRDKYPEIQKALDDIIESRIDIAEGQLIKNIEEGKETSLIFFLKTIGRRRGYIEKQQVEHSGTVSIESVIDTMDDSQRKRFISFLESQSQSKKD